eukprot:TRINITY_DN138_c0_g1_i2.p1 TRINITY_DN138_c0_g1~~TRINITY_DN138_c0_g1_i2.p1  ORF type:complete len:241 (+),score=53.31 TRINITY_DN138_c0_g1_i2:75-797(+)
MGNGGSRRKGSNVNKNNTDVASPRSQRSVTTPVPPSNATPPSNLPTSVSQVETKKAPVEETKKETKDRSPKKKPEQEAGNPHKKIEELFLQYKDEENAIGPAGMEKLCKDLGVNPEDISVLVLAYHLDAKEMGYFTREEFCKGLQKINCDNLNKLKSLMSSTFKEDLKNATTFKEIFKFAFSFAKEGDRKYLELPTAVAMLSLLLTDQSPHTTRFLEFLQEVGAFLNLSSMVFRFPLFFE